MANLNNQFRKIIDFELRAFSGKSKVQLFWRMQRTSYVLYYLIKQFDRSKRSDVLITDVGCGPGIVSSFFAKRGFSIIGIDKYSQLIDFANSYFEKLKLSGKFIQADITTDYPAFHDINSDVIICIDAIEHFSDIEKTLENFKKILGGSGRILLTTPNFGNPLFLIIEKLWDFFGKTPGWHHLHVTRLGLDNYIKLFRRSGFKVVESGTFMIISPFISIFSTRVARFISRLERYLLNKLKIGMMMFIHAIF
ncbi:MAG: class I SAM-dependent methyltransferase [Promethearchaeota archaeon]